MRSRDVILSFYRNIRDPISILCAVWNLFRRVTCVSSSISVWPAMYPPTSLFLAKQKSSDGE